ncbi:unnamed protein product [Cuscuta campestris]|uniref:Uncharacterized protein n=1 Tax=Cuscuta campestris TaxID=132261 RepID=A0A484MX96_9ASTE|nr:unnamed protein product [Cuscuta campestris]
MEDLWDEINLSSLPFRRGPRIPVAFQDFLARPFAAAARDTPPPPPPPVSGKPTSPEFHFFGGAHHHHHPASNPLLQPPYSASSDGSFDGLPPAGPDRRRRRRVHHDSVDKRHARTEALETEVAILLKENARLNKQYERLRQECSKENISHRFYNDIRFIPAMLMQMDSNTIAKVLRASDGAQLATRSGVGAASLAVVGASSGRWSVSAVLVLPPVLAALDDVMSPAATGVVSSVAGRGSDAGLSVAASKTVGAAAPGRLGGRVIRSSSIGNGPSDTGIG